MLPEVGPSLLPHVLQCIVSASDTRRLRAGVRFQGKKIPTLLSELERMRRFEYETHLSVRAPTILSGTSRCCFHLEQVHCCFLDVSLLAACSSLFFPG